MFQYKEVVRTRKPSGVSTSKRNVSLDDVAAMGLPGCPGQLDSTSSEQFQDLRFRLVAVCCQDIADFDHCAL